MEAFFVKSTTGEDSLAYNRIKYDLIRIAYNPTDHTWGKLETVISSNEMGLSINQPRISPDGHFLVFTASQYSSFPIFHNDADLYLLNLTNGQKKRLELNSTRADGFHSWSSNGRWIVFSSKREDTQFTRLYLSYIDSLGNTSKAFILPQEDPLFYETCLEVYNVPEFVKEPIKISPLVLAKIAFSEPLKAILDPNVLLNRNNEKTQSVAKAKVQ
jgi:dipeptidyl aminopeptidase/acylaminoacyl peptidase